MLPRIRLIVALATVLLGAAFGQGPEKVKITSGPTIEHVTATSATIAWSTNVNASTVLNFGTDPAHLSETKGLPWGGLTHRVTLEDLEPNTTYFFQVVSGEAQGTGTQASSQVSQFKTTGAPNA